MHSERIRKTISKQGIVKGYKHSDCLFLACVADRRRGGTGYVF